MSWAWVMVRVRDGKFSLPSLKFPSSNISAATLTLTLTPTRLLPLNSTRPFRCTLYSPNCSPGRTQERYPGPKPTPNPSSTPTLALPLVCLTSFTPSPSISAPRHATRRGGVAGGVLWWGVGLGQGQRQRSPGRVLRRGQARSAVPGGQR